MDAASLKDKREHIRKELAKNRHKADVERIVQAALRFEVDRNVLFQLLALVAVPDPPTYRRSIIRAQKRWKSLSEQLETVAKHGERLVSDPLAHMEGHIPSLQDSFRPPVPPQLFREMRVYARYAHLQARWLGTFLRRISQTEKWNGANLLLYVRAGTGKLFENELARLLDEACEIAGTDKKFTPGKLRKLWKRHVLPIASEREKIARYHREVPAQIDALRHSVLHTLDKSTP